jgi:hypothetical protein
MNNDHSDDSRDLDDEQGPERIFRVLKNRPTDELDSAALWRRIEADLEPHPARGIAGWFDRVAAAVGLDDAQPMVPRLAVAGAVVVLMAAVIWLVPGMMQSDATDPATGVANPAPAAEPLAAASQEWMLDVRLVRSYDGAVPADALTSSAAGAGGADRLADLRGALADLMPFDEYALVGQWQGRVEATGTTLAQLSDSFELSFAAANGATGVNLADVLLDGAGRPLVANELALAPGRPYLFGVQAEGEASDTGSLVLAVRLVAVSPDGAFDASTDGDSTDQSSSAPQDR